MVIPSEFDSYDSPEAEELIRSAASRWFSSDRRVLLTETAFGIAFLVVAMLIAVLVPAHRSFGVADLAIVVPCLAAQRVRFPVGSAWSSPIELVFVPMLFILPLPAVPLVALGCRLGALLPDVIEGGTSRHRLLAAPGDVAFTLGPVLVLALFAKHQFTWTDWPIYVAAFCAQVVFDLTSGLGRTWFAEGIRPSKQISMVYLYVTEACLACSGLVLAAASAHRPVIALLALPQIGLLGLFARERSERIDNTIALSTAYRGTAMLLGDVIEDDDEYTGFHSRAVVDLSLAVADRLGLDASARRNVEFGALLHDVGKIRVPKEIIHKPGKLNDAEWAIMRQHTIYGEEMLRQVGGTLSSVGRVVRGSHERWDGTGYPDGLAGEAIPVEARIVCACDAFNAMTTHRPYRRAMALDEACAELTRCSGTHFDPKVVYALLAEVTENPQILGPVQAGTDERPVATRSTVSTA